MNKEIYFLLLFFKGQIELKLMMHILVMILVLFQEEAKDEVICFIVIYVRNNWKWNA